MFRDDLDSDSGEKSHVIRGLRHQTGTFDSEQDGVKFECIDDAAGHGRVFPCGILTDVLRWS